VKTRGKPVEIILGLTRPVPMLFFMRGRDDPGRGNDDPDRGNAR
jgi:hypothetical protein